MSEKKRTGAAKLASLSATVLLVSLGLCGANFFLVMRFVPLSGPGPQPGEVAPPEWPGQVLGVMGVLELLGIAAGVVGLIIAMLQKVRAGRGQ